MKLGFLYAGQGSQHAGMGADLYEQYPAFRQVLDSIRLDFDLKKTCFEDPDGVLTRTEFTQPCMVAFAVGVTAILKEMGIEPALAAGLSLGEYSALQAAGVWDAATTVKIAAFRGNAMMQAAKGIDCAMSAVLGLEREKVLEACRIGQAAGIVEACNFNCAGNIAIGGETAAVAKAVEAAKALGAKRCVPLKVSGPFHTPIMKPAGDALREFFQTIPFGTPQIPVLFNCLGHEAGPEDTIPELLERQVQKSVYMEDCIRRMAEMGAEAFIEIGPGKVLSGFVRKTTPEISCYKVESAEEIAGLPAWLKGVQA